MSARGGELYWIIKHKQIYCFEQSIQSIFGIPVNEELTVISI